MFGNRNDKQREQVVQVCSIIMGVADNLDSAVNDVFKVEDDESIVEFEKCLKSLCRASDSALRKLEHKIMEEVAYGE